MKRIVKQPSRRGKKAWRKNVDIHDVEEGLAEVRNERLLTGGLVKEQPSEQLFQVDVQGDAKIAAKVKKTIKPLKVDEILAQRSAVAPVVSQKRKRDTVSKEDKHKLKRIAKRPLGYTNDNMASVQEWLPKTTKIHDAWEESEHKDESEPYIQPSLDVKLPKTFRQEPVRLSENGKRFASIPLPDPGISYNPAVSDWEELILREGQLEVELEKSRIAEENERTRIRELAQEPERVMELSDEESRDAESQSEVVEKKAPTRKTKAQRHRQEKRKAEARADQAQKNQRKMLQDLENIKNLKRAISANGNGTSEIAKNKSPVNEIDHKATVRKRRLGKHAVLPARSDFQLAEELADSLRTLKPEGSILRDRYRSLQERGIVEARIPVTKRKPKVMVQEKHSYKKI